MVIIFIIIIIILTILGYLCLLFLCNLILLPYTWLLKWAVRNREDENVWFTLVLRPNLANSKFINRQSGEFTYYYKYLETLIIKLETVALNTITTGSWRNTTGDNKKNPTEQVTLSPTSSQTHFTLSSAKDTSSR